jgi:endogenous inhibitor of DNA gyrase (YacG/DUF329 family)
MILKIEPLTRQMICKTCNKESTRLSFRKRFCSRECKKSYSRYKNNICMICKKQYEYIDNRNSRFCSNICLSAYINKRYTHNN